MNYDLVYLRFSTDCLLDIVMLDDIPPARSGSQGANRSLSPSRLHDGITNRFVRKGFRVVISPVSHHLSPKGILSSHGGSAAVPAGTVDLAEPP